MLFRRLSGLLIVALASFSFAARLGAAEPKSLLDVSAEDATKRLTPSYGTGDQITLTRSTNPAGIVLTVAPGKAGYPGMELKPQGSAVFDLSAYGHAEMKVTNVGTKPGGIALRVDNVGNGQGEPWNTEQVWLDPGKSGTISVIFGYAYGQKPNYALNPAAVNNILIFAHKSDSPQSFRIESLVAAGPAGERPPVDPNAVRVIPTNNTIIGPNAGADAAKGPVRISCPAGKAEQSATIKPPVSRWDLRQATEVRVKLRNDGKTTITPSAQLTSNAGTTDAVTGTQLAPGAQAELVIPFAPAKPAVLLPHNPKAGFYASKPNTGTTFGSDAVSGITLKIKHDGEASVSVESVTVAAPPVDLPDWMGKRPPVEGEWVKTFDDSFDGNSIDQSKWNIYGPNYWDKATHWSKDNLVLKDGMAVFHYEKKRGHHNDDPKEKETDYVCGFLETYGKWVQRYGYFECRLKLPEVPGLWPAFWMMPDRGAALGEQWKRQATDGGATEIDIMEHLTRWGPYRYNLAVHYDGYEKEHKAIGSAYNYVQHDKDGFITAGLLWLPGQMVWYCNGKEIARWDDARVSNVQSDIMLEITTGGWDNNSVDDKQLPVDWVIDYVRAWQRKDLASPVDGYQKPAAPTK